MALNKTSNSSTLKKGLKPKLKLKKTAKPKIDILHHIGAIGYTGEYRDNFPWKPKILNSEIVTTKRQLEELSSALMEVEEFAFDTETNTLEVLGENKEFKLVGISISWGENYNYYVPTGHVRDEDINNQLDLDVVVDSLKEPFGRTDLRIIGHNLKFDMHVLKRVGIDINTRDAFDTMLASWLCDENTPNGLKENSQEKLGIMQTNFKDVTSTVPTDVRKAFGYKANSRVPFDLVLVEEGAPYALDDSFYTYCLYLGFVAELEDIKMDNIYYQMTVPFLFTLFKMQERGTQVDKKKLEQMGIEMQKDLDELQYKIYEYAGVEFNVGSGQQKAEILFGYRKPDIPVKVNTKFPKWIDNIIKESALKAKEVKRNERQGLINKANKELAKSDYYLDNEGKLFKRANVNQDILDMSFDFPIQGQTKSGAPSTDTNSIWTISQMSYKIKRKQQGVEMCKLMMEYSKLSKLKSAFVEGLLGQLYEDNKAHPSFNQIGTDSGRISCSKPNLQQLPNADDEDKYQIRSAFIGSEYYVDKTTGELITDITRPRKLSYKKKRMKILALDYHNLEMVCLTYFSKDKNLSEMFANNYDSHGSTAVNMFGLDCEPNEVKEKYPHLRQAAKTINFLLMYGGGANLLYEKLKSDHYSPVDLGDKKYLEEYKCRNGAQVAQKFIDRYFDSYEGVARFIKGQKRYAHKNEYVFTILGRKRRLPFINSQDRGQSSYGERLAVNSAVQGTAGDITISAQNRIDSDDRIIKDYHCRMIIQVHDELVFECPEETLEEVIPIIEHYMEHPFGDDEARQVPYLSVDYGIGDNYQQAK